jgi:hypothetical protein
MRGWAGLIALAGCGRIGFGDLPPDAPLGAFGAPQPVSELSSPNLDDDPALSDDLLEIFWTSSRAGSSSCDIWTSVRADPTAPWPAPTNVAELNSGLCDSGASLSHDGKTLYLASTRLDPMNALADVFVATRSGRGSPWSTPVLVEELMSPAQDGSPSLTVDERVGIMFSTRISGDDLFEVRRASAGAVWGTPIERADINTSSRDRSPSVSTDGLTIWFISDRPGGLGLNDIYEATRPALDSPFGPAVNLRELNTPDSEDDPWVSPDGRTIFWAGKSAAGDSEIFMATR